MVEQLLSGGQSGIDVTALRVARELGIPTGGYAPRGWKTEVGPAPWLADFGLVEAPTSDYPARTRLNVQAADHVLVLTWGPPSGGTLLTIRLAQQLGKPSTVVDLSFASQEEVERTVAETRVAVCTAGRLLVGGPRESKHPGLGELAGLFLLEVLGPRA